jgi:hypothetical protein
MRKKRAFALGIVLLSLFIGTTVYATTAVALSNRALAENATVIATGRCTAIRTVWEGRVLVTLATIAVTDVLKGEPGETLTVALPGGVDANRKFPISMVYPGAPQIGVGEDVFVFLRQDEGLSTGLTVLGFSQGKFSIVDDEQGQKVVSRNLSTIMLQTPAGTRRGAATKVRLDEFKNEVRGYLR